MGFLGVFLGQGGPSTQRTHGCHPRAPLQPLIPDVGKGSGSIPPGRRLCPAIKTNIWEPRAASPPQRPPPAAPLAAAMLRGIIFAPRFISAVVTRQIPRPIFFAACRSWEEGLPVSIAIRLALISISFLGELITKGVTK